MILFVLVCHLNLFMLGASIQRVYYVGLEEVTWDYAPQGNLFNKDNRASDIYLENSQTVPSIGTKYKKAMYMEYTDGTFTNKKSHPTWMGIMGVFFKAEIGDHIIVHFHNTAKANHSFTLHPHGVFYNKNSEGTLYVDGTSKSNKQDDGVAPGHNHTYVWIVHPDYGPTASDPECIPWLVHSHRYPEEEVPTGALAMMATCKKGVLDEVGNRRKPNVKEFPLLFMMIDENFSFYMKENIRTYLPNVDSDYIASHYTAFQKSNMKYSINGFIYGNLPDLEVCAGNTVIFYLASMGNDFDVETVYLQGHNMIVYHHRMDTVDILPGSSLTAIITKLNPGKWLLSSQSLRYIEAGMHAFFTVNNNCISNSPSTTLVNDTTETLSAETNSSGSLLARRIKKTKYYYIMAEEIWWNYAPTNNDIVHGIPLNEHPTAKASFGISTIQDCKMNGRYKKALFKGYRDKRFKSRLPHPQHLGFLGPRIIAEVGDTIKVTFYNKASKNYSIQAYRFFVEAIDSGIQYDQGPNVIVQPNEKKIYIWRVPKSVAPTEADPDCLLGRYYSAVDPVADTYSGLTGPLLVCKKGRSLHSSHKWVDKEFFLSFSDVDETASHYFEENVAAACPRSDINALKNNNDFLEANLMRSLNGRVYGNLKGLTMCRGDRVNWYMMSVGSGATDLHTPYFHGNTLRINGASKDAYGLIPDKFITASMICENPGTWSLEDQVTTFQGYAQMEFLYEVQNCSDSSDSTPTASGKTRIYYIAAVERTWDYAPLNQHIITGQSLSENTVSQVSYNHDVNRNQIGHQYIKALYREYTDDTFKTEKERDARDLHLGTLGPFIRAEVGDTIQVVFKNMASFNFSIMPHGLLYTKANEGYKYNDKVPSNQKKGAAVPPGETFTYEWFVSDNDGPGPDDFNCVTSFYRSYVDAKDVAAGLVGPLVICKDGILGHNGTRIDVDREWALFFYIYLEMQSPYIEKNIKKYLNKEPHPDVFNSPLFFESNVKMSINGYIFGNTPNATMYLGETTAVSLISLGNMFSTHTVHFHGNTFVRRVSGTHRHDVMDVLPGDFQMVELTGINKGTWLIHCHVNNHSENGMVMTYNVIDPSLPSSVNDSFSNTLTHWLNGTMSVQLKLD